MENLFEFEIEPKFTVHYLKTMIREKIGLYPHQQNLIYNDIALDNSKIFEEYSINEIYIKVHEQNGNEFVLQINPNNSVKKLKIKIETITTLKIN